MARQLRLKGDSGYYHVIVRGAGKRVLFEDVDDHLAMLGMVNKFAKECGIELLAYCLMSNHMHLVVYDSKQTLSVWMQKIEVSYAQRYNTRYDHVGPVFQGRFESVLIGSKEQLMNEIRYVHQNPVRAGVDGIDTYEWSSYCAYLGCPKSKAVVLATDRVMGLFGSEDAYQDYMGAFGNVTMLGQKQKVKITDEDALRLLHELLNDQELKALDGSYVNPRDSALKRLSEAGLSVRQIGRLTGLGRYVISKAIES